MLSFTGTFAAFMAIMLIGLSLAVSFKRVSTGVNIGSGEDPDLLRRIRAQGNFIEYVPIALILCSIAELRGAGINWLWVLAILLIFGRLIHAAGTLVGSTPMRAIGMLATYAAILAGAGAQFAV